MNIPKLVVVLFFIWCGQLVYAQEPINTRPCGTMVNLERLIKTNKTTAEKRATDLQRVRELINKQGIQLREKTLAGPKSSGFQKGVNALCTFFNDSSTTITAPVIKNQLVSPSPNCVSGGKYVRVVGLIKGNTYRISTCGINNFDTQLTIFPQGSLQALAYNDDWCGDQSEICFTPEVSGNYNVQVTANSCLSNTACANLEVELLNTPGPKVVIPVVVHVLNYGEPVGQGRNISVAQINSQLVSLNKDFRRLNTNFSTAPAAFRGVSMDANIEFCLAQQDENGQPTTGITRPMTNYPTVTMNDLEFTIKPQTIWDPSKYLNIWVADFDASEMGLLGYAQFPGGPSNTDGIAVKFSAFGTTGNLNFKTNTGRVSVHEIGHWLNLYHIWGDDSDCSGSDMIADTPDQEVETYVNFPVFPLLDLCSPDYPGVMFQNYMDYTKESFMNVFTYGQVMVMQATLQSDRSSLITSKGCVSKSVSLTTIAEEKIAGIYPNPSTGYINIDFATTVKDANVVVLNSLGAVVRRVKVNDSTQARIDLSMLAQGVYFVNVEIENSVGHYRIVVE